MKKNSLIISSLLFLVGCTQTTTQHNTSTVQTTEKTTTTQTTKKESSESSTVNDNLEVVTFDNKAFEIRATRRWLKQESTNGNLLTLVGYRSRANIFFSMAKTTETSLETVATNSFKEYAKQYKINATLPLITLKNAVHPTIKSIYDMTKTSERQVLIVYTVDMKGSYINVVALVSSDVFEEIRQELDTMVNSLKANKQ